MIAPPDWCRRLRDCEVRCDNCPENEMTDKCPSCEYNKLRAEMWREEAYKQAGRPLPEPQREWQGLTDEEAKRVFEQHNCTISADLAGILARAIKAKLKEKNNGDR